MASRPAAGKRPPASPGVRLSLRDPTVRALLYQVLAIAGVALVAWYLISNTIQNLETRKIASGFGFLDREAGLPVGEAMIAYSPADSYLRALIVGVLNTLRVAVVGIVLATILGALIGIARLSKNWLLARAATIYVEVARNLPLLLQLIFWWTVFRDIFPGPREAYHPIAGVFMSNRGLQFPSLIDDPAHVYIVAAFLVGIVVAFFLRKWAQRRQDATGQQFPVLWSAVALVFGLPALVFLAAGAPFRLDVPSLQGFNFVGGSNLTPEFAALLVGLTLYTGAFIAEIVRSGILAVSYGQTEAALALGMRRGFVLRLIILPQALRVIVPPLTSQYLNLTKNSSLAVAIGYPDLVNIANTTINQTGQAVEGIAIIMAVYLTVSLSISAFMNWYNRKIALVER
ncbi:MAG: amino acid ABC transporter permease [Rhodospirillales bacterium]|nr:amino acid ABC transporter permease [Rhodospirillales bacterium]